MERKNIHKNIRELFGGEYDYIVPLYQRNFAWGEPEITQLLQDIYESYQAQHPYFVGSIIVLNRNNVSNRKLEVIDGQQRLTVITLLLKVLGQDYLPDLMTTRLEYDSRDEVTLFLNNINAEALDSANASEVIKTFNAAISTIKYCPLDAETERTYISKMAKDCPEELHSFAEYIATQVFFVLAEMPTDTDVAAYFEIMNNSGDQLKKHEILKAQILGSLQNRLTLDELKSLAIIWNACSQMEIRIQKAIDAPNRHLLFGEHFDSFVPENITLLAQAFETNEKKELTITDIIDNDTFQQKETASADTEDNTENIGESIIDFPNFLMHIFRICYNDEYKSIVGADNDIPLNEKNLLDVYRALANKIDGKKFIAQLLYYRIILDRYIIRTDINSESAKWTLRRPHKSSSNNGVWFGKSFSKNDNEDTESDDAISQTEDNAIKALSMLQVSYPQRKYKRYLYEILSWFEYGNVQYGLNWYLPKLNGLILKNLDEIIEEYGEELFSLGTGTPRFMLNAIDYLMYLSGSDANFEFKYYNSVEHHLPQSREVYGEKKYDSRTIDSIGNLFLLSRRVNSSLNDGDPLTKTDKAATQIDSMPPNRRLIYERTKNNRRWGKEDIEHHETEIISLLEHREELLRQITLEESPFLYRACLAVTDYCSWYGTSGGGGRYSFKDLTSPEARAALAEVSKWQGRHLNLTLESFIEEQLSSNDELKQDSWRRCFVKYPSVTEYCMNGKFARIKDGAIIYLLPQDRMSDWAHELRSHLIYDKAVKAGLSTGIDRYGLWFPLDGTPFLEIFPKADMSLHIWVSYDGSKWCYELYSGRNANAKENIFLSSNGWTKNENGHFYIEGRVFLCDCPSDYERAINVAYKEILKLLSLINNLC